MPCSVFARRPVSRRFDGIRSTPASDLVRRQKAATIASRIVNLAAATLPSRSLLHGDLGLKTAGVPNRWPFCVTDKGVYVADLSWRSRTCLHIEPACTLEDFGEAVALCPW
jgi:hypothetical protein